MFYPYGPAGGSNLRAPVPYDYKNAYNASFNPSTIHVEDTTLNRFFERQLLFNLLSVFKFTLPKTWNKAYVQYVLACWGFLGVVNTDKFGVIPQGCTLYGYGVFYQPTGIRIANPLLQDPGNLTIGLNCTVIKLLPDFGGLMDVVSFYANRMALAVESICGNILNSKLAYIFYGANKRDRQTNKSTLDQILSGQPAVFLDATQKIGDNMEIFSNNIGANYIADKVSNELRNIENEFYTKVGIPNANTAKRERLNGDEVHSNDIATGSLVSVVMDTLRDGFEETRNMFGFSESELAIDWSDLIRGDSIYSRDSDPGPELPDGQFSPAGEN